MNESVAWARVPADGTSPPPRNGHSLTALPGKLVLFGGVVRGVGSSNDVYSLNTQTVPWAWSKRATTGDAPSARSGHSAVALDATRVLVFGGQVNVTTMTAFNDVHVLDTASWTWTRVDTSGGAPPPRSRHSAVLHGTRLVVYGGFGPSNAVYNDVFVLDTEQWVWTKPKAKGSPKSRFGHAAALAGARMFVTSGTTKHNEPVHDLSILNVETMEWTETEQPVPPQQVSRHTLVGVRSAVTHKVFSLNGQVRPMYYSNQVDYFDTETNTWTTIEVAGDAPLARCDSQAAYDADSGLLVVVGGWANEFLADVYTLDVRPIVGPDYVLTSVEPVTGPVFNATEVHVFGQNFHESSAIKVLFTDGDKKHVPVAAKYVSPTEVVCTTPSFEAFGPQDVFVRVTCDNVLYTVPPQRIAYRLFLDTKSGNCVAYGPGVLPAVPTAMEQSVVLWAKDRNGRQRKSGGDVFTVTVEGPPEAEGGAPTAVPATIEDVGDGTYIVRYTANAEGAHVVHLTAGSEHVRGSPFKVEAKASLQKSQPALGAHTFNMFPVMKQRMAKELSELETTVNTYAKTQDMKIQMGDLEGLLKMMSCIDTVKKTRDDVELRYAQLTEVTAWLRAKGDVAAAKQEQKLTESGKVWANVKKQNAVVDKALKPYKDHSRQTVQREVEAFAKKVKEFDKAFRNRPFYTYATGYDDAYKALAAGNEDLKGVEVESQRLKVLADLFDFPQLIAEAMETIATMRADIAIVKQVWDIVMYVECQMAAWKKTLWADINTEEMEDQMKRIPKETRTLDKKVRSTNVFIELSSLVRTFTATLPLVANLSHPSMRERHWQLLMKTTGVSFVMGPDFSLQHLIDLNLPQFEGEVEEIVDRAQKEEKMEAMLNKIDATWKAIKFTFTRHKDSNVYLVSMAEEEFETLEDQQVMVQNMIASKYLATYEKEVMHWKKSLANVADVTQLFQEIQRTWAYLEVLFIGSEEVQRELPDDVARFRGIDGTVRDVLTKCKQLEVVVDLCNVDGLLRTLQGVQKELSICEKSLADYLESKRTAFPRFYFVSTADLLDILSNGNQPRKIMRHLPKIFQAVKHFDLETADVDGRPVATAMESSVGQENVPLSRKLHLTGKVEEYLHKGIAAMREALTDTLGKAISTYCVGKERHEWVRDYPSQLTLVCTQVYWTREVMETLTRCAAGEKDALRAYNKKQIEQLTNLIKMVQGDLSAPLRVKAMVLITLDTHARDVIANLVAEGVTDPTSFQWQSQLQQRWDAQKKMCYINICDAEFAYGFEYLGNGPRLVITPLTDRIYITATQSLHLKMGCAPAGPAGTGKTETVKDLSAQCGKPVYVFNCSDQMDYQSMGNIFKGLAASGSWGCFDEFNRLLPEVLSVCAVQFKTVIDAMRGNRPTFTLLGSTLSLDRTFGVFITMNPGYLGRSELPESLKALFRPITVVVPDLELICENMLMAEGFIEAKVLARKFVTLYALCRDLLSKQDHYDWGLRAIKAVLVVAGGFKRAEPTIPEEHILMRALRDSNLAKIPANDVPVFMGLIGDLFPGVDLPRRVDQRLTDGIHAVCKERNFQPEDVFVLKIQQLDELLTIRHCIFVIGNSGSGKSGVWSTLAKTWTKLGRPTMVRDINPKSITANELYGYVQLSTREWKDGLLSNQMRELGEIPDTNPKWIILDGDLDTNWIESMNSVMDDNKILTLASNERIPLLPHMRMIFEIRDLRFATPATVSRAGIIYVSDGKQWQSFARSWVDSAELAHLSATARETLRALFDEFCPQLIGFIQKQVVLTLNILPFNMVQTLCHMLTGLLKKEHVPDERKDDKTLFEQFFAFAVIWSFGGALAEKDGVDYRKRFSDWFKDTFRNIKFPARGGVYDVYMDPVSKQFQVWRDIVPTIEYESGTPMSQVTVPTPETTSVRFWLDMLIDLRKPCMLVGNAGCGKTALVQGKLRTLSEDYIFLAVNLNYYTDSMALQTALEVPLEKKAGRNFGPPGAKKLIYFIDDLNMPMLDAYNTQQPIALMRQHIDYGHWYDRTKLAYQNIKVVQDTMYLAAMNPTAGSFVVNPRLQRHFCTFAVNLPGPISLMDIYRTFLSGHLKDFPAAVQELKTKIIEATLMLHGKVTETFRKTAINFHYEFNIRHLANVFQGMLMSQASQFRDDDGPVKFVELWLHECERVYCDRLVSGTDASNYRKLAKLVNSKYFANFNLDAYFRDKDPPTLVFSHFANGTGADKVYNKVASMDRLKQILDESLAEYNEDNPNMNLLLFDDACRHVCRISRIIENPSGHALLVGVGGSGKQSLSRLAAFVAGYTVSQITISSNFGVADLKEHLKGLYTRAGLKDEGLMFLFTDSQITNERFLVYINDLLASGDIPDLFPTDEKDNVVNAIRAEVKASGLQDTREVCWEFFLNKVKRNLHVVLCFSPVGDAFAVRPRRFPALVNSTVIDWFHAWPEDALLGVARRFLSEVDLGTDEVRDGIVRFMPFAFRAVNDVSVRYKEIERRFNYTTPKSFLGVIDLYKSMLGKRRAHLSKAIDRLQSGLEKLEKTARDVAVLEEELKVKMVEVEEAKEAADAFAEEVGIEKAKVQAETERANMEQEKCEKIAADVGVQKRECERQLAEAEPAVKRAEEALDTVTKKDLGETKVLKTPPSGVDDITAAVLVLLSDKKGVVKDRSWKAATQAMNNVDRFLQALRGFKEVIDAGDVPAANFQAVRPYLALPHFTRDKIYSKSRAAAGLCDWVINIVEYYDIVQNVEPLRQALAAAEANLAAAETKLAEVNALVAELQAKLAVLVQQFDKAVADKEAAIAEAARCQSKLDLAQRLVRAVGSEQERWALGVQTLNNDLEVVVGDVLLAASFVSYIGCFSKKFRQELLDKYWVPYLREHKVPLSANTDILKILTDEAEMAKWMSESLPADRVSLENGVIVSNCERWPLLIDPQLQGIKWVKDKEAGNDLLVLRLGQNKMLQKLEFAMENGHSVLIENMGESIDAVLAPVISRQTIKKLGVLYVRLGDHEVEWGKGFKLFLHTKLSNPHYPPEIQAETTLINFTVTEEGLEEQLLAVVVQKERPDLEAMKAKLIEEQNSFKIKLKELEDGLLARLSSAQGDLTENVELIENLEDTKRVSDDIKVKMATAVVTEKNINKAREIYRPVAARGSLLFFLLMNMRRIHAFYQYSLAAFKVVFLRGIDRLPVVKAVEEPDEAEQVDAAAGGAPAAAAAAADGAAPAGDASVPSTPALGADGGNAPGTPAGDGAAATAASATAPGTPAPAPAPAAAAAPAPAASSAAAPAAPAAGAAGGAAPAESEDVVDPALLERISGLVGSITFAVFQYTRRGLFEKHKLTFAAQLTFKILRKEGKIDAAEFEFLVQNKRSANPPAINERVAQFLTPQAWAGVHALSELTAFAALADDVVKFAPTWEKWCQEEKPEVVELPDKARGQYRWNTLTRFQKLLVIRAMRPDRLTSALTDFVEESLGRQYVDQEPFNIVDIYRETSATTPLFFILFPGASPLNDVVALGSALEHTTENGKLATLAMGQGQEKAAEGAMDKFTESGGWVFLDNVHLMERWLGQFESKLEASWDHGHENFRCFFSAEANPDPYGKTVPESVIQTSIKIVNEPQQSLKANLKRALNNFDDAFINKSSRPTEFKTLLFTLCFFHSVVIGRRKFGAQGWSRSYPFNNGDLTISADVLFNYIESNPEVPWRDLRYLFGEIMYGGHITDGWDRRTCATYLSVMMEPKLFAGKELAPGLKVPDVGPTQAHYMDFCETLPRETPALFGMHANAEIGFLTSSGETLFSLVMDLDGAASGAGGAKRDQVVSEMIDSLEGRLPEEFMMLDIQARIPDPTPHLVVMMQEMERMNRLLAEIRRSLKELKLGLQGALNISEAMESLANGIFVDRVHGSWTALAYPSLKPLGAWFADLLQRVAQLARWGKELKTPPSVWISGLFNPMSFLTAVMQVTAREGGFPLDNMCLQTNIINTPVDQITEMPDDGAYVHGMFLEGARWDTNRGVLADQVLKELHPALPVMHVTAVTIDQRRTTGIYDCPLYITSLRGPTFVTTTYLATSDEPSKWVLRGVALVMSDD